MGDQAKGVFGDFGQNLLDYLPRVAVVVGLLVAAWLITRLVRFVVRRAFGKWPRSTAALAVASIGVWMVALGLSTSVLVDDVRAFAGSIGLLGLALSWALQVPIESFTGWLLNSFKGYYRVGDRVEVGDVFGDVHRIDVLTTTVWEIGSPFRDGFVRAEQPTGRLITFPNNQVLTGSVMNFTRHFAFVWDELTVQVANESDMRHCLTVLQRVAQGVLGDSMESAAARYAGILRQADLEQDVPADPQVFIALEEQWTTVTIRYLVGVHQRRKRKSDLVLAVCEELARPEHQGRIVPVLPRRQLQWIGRDGLAWDPGGT